MNGFSDVRLVLHSQELQVQRPVARSTGVGRPPAFSRWQWFWHCQRTRRQLSALTAHQLADIGLTPEQARAEFLKKFWQP